ncbi:FecR family protein [Leptospira bandrabouensis]|uniref:FecR family protein n=1 Tax=Leptospira bandrabouensis TaxID=2484903 RepID=UPI001EE95A13|nr:FecR family protein [Leptospira bandrabouensis]MCG6143045.1 FecR domain-containing protein [Leptospira bandrabouensis]MCG6151925.1 FecR domain-containing protein [Leptospira bandrabouensis]MCG6158704.1 FecR domain-containing protein [Leptospira bandrabouensis]MCG6162640.1 FecR domain-containing protein [Leptospira bandrabouensis]MCW7459712.1 FecR domain-containing protein [Leptospira bandrabouensis]
MIRFAVSVLFLLFAATLSAEEVGIVSFIQGKNYLSGPRFKKAKEPVKLGSILKKGDTITTEDGTCEIQLATQATIRLSKFTSMQIEDLLNPKSKATTLKLVGGKLFVKAYKPASGVPSQNQLKVVNPSFVAGVRGTEFLAAAPDTGGTDDEMSNVETGVYVNEGTVAVSPDKKGKETLVKENEEVLVSGKELKKQILDEFVKEKMRIFQEFKAIKEENYQRIKDQYEKNDQLMNEYKGKTEE